MNKHNDKKLVGALGEYTASYFKNYKYKKKIVKPF